MVARILIIELTPFPLETCVPGASVVRATGVAEAARLPPSDVVVLSLPSDMAAAQQALDAVRAAHLVAPKLAVLPEDAPDALFRSCVGRVDDFVIRPLRKQDLQHRLSRLLAERGSEEIATATVRIASELGLRDFIGRDPAFLATVGRLPRLAHSDANLLITGETGTGKELCARAVHHLSNRRAHAFIAVDCGAFPDHLFENELFGHARGAYTDAREDQKGLAALAEGGTLFLDEVDNLSPPAQGKLLRFVQERTFRPLGSDRFVRCDVRIVAATNRNLAECVRDGRFRPDLMFRLDVLHLDLVPLRHRRSDIPLLARHFLRTLADEGPRTLTSSAAQKLEAYDWPGNVRELRNVVQRATVLGDGAQVQPAHLLLDGESPATVAEGPLPMTFNAARAQVMSAFEKRYLTELLRKHDGNITQAAREAQKERRAFGRLVKKHSLNPQQL